MNEEKFGGGALKKTAFVLLLIAVLSVGAWLWLGNRPVQVETATASFAPIAQVVSQEGTVKAKEDVRIGFDMQGRIVSLEVEEGEKVSSGQLIATLDDSLLAASLKQADAELKVQESIIVEEEVALGQAKREYDRAVSLFEEQVVSSEERDRAKTAFEASEKRILTAKARLRQLESSVRYRRTQLAKTRIYSPVDGTAIQVYAKAGEVVAPGSPVVRIITSEKTHIEAEIAEADIGRIHTGQEVIITADAYPDVGIPGKLMRIDPMAMRKGSIIEVTRAAEEKVFRGIVVPENPEERLLVGLSVYLDFVIERKERALVVPREAVREEVSSYSVFVVRDRRVQKVDVVIGLKDWLNVEILKGLREGDEVVLSPAATLKDGARVRVAKPSSGRTAS